MARLLFVSHEIEREILRDAASTQDEVVYGVCVNSNVAVALSLHGKAPFKAVARFRRLEGRRLEWSVDGNETTLINYKQPDARKHRFLSLRGLNLDTQSGARDLNPSQLYLSDVVREVESHDFSRNMHASPVPWEDVLSVINGGEITPTSQKTDGTQRSYPITRTLDQLRTVLNKETFYAISLCDLSSFLFQVDTRLAQISAAPQQFSKSRAFPLSNDAKSTAIYISLYNTLWLIINDIILGSAISALLADNALFISTRLDKTVSRIAITYPKTALLWLNSWPAGLKLNQELGNFFCDAFLWFLSVWEITVITPLQHHQLLAILVLAFSGRLGATFALSLLADIISLLCFHLYVFYLATASIYAWHSRALLALFNIFRGKKYNIARARTEPAEYDTDQLLVGTILFTLAAFLFPTVVAFYLVFAITRLGLISLHAGIETVLAFLNHFPLFAIMLRIKDPARLPGGLKIQFSNNTLAIKNKAIPMAAIFFQFLHLTRRLVQHYSPLVLLRKAMTGNFILPIARYRLRYGNV